MAQYPSSDQWNYSQSFITEDSSLIKARDKSKELGLSAIGQGVGSLLKFLASTIDASNVVEIGTGTGVSGLWLFRGMNSAGVLTSIDSDQERQRAAKEIFSEAGIASNKIRLIAGRAIEVVAKLTDNAYDLMFISGDKLEYETLLDSHYQVVGLGEATDLIYRFFKILIICFGVIATFIVVAMLTKPSHTTKHVVLFQIHPFRRMMLTMLTSFTLSLPLHRRFAP